MRYLITILLLAVVISTQAQSAKERKAQRKKEQAEALQKYKAVADAKNLGY